MVLPLIAPLVAAGTAALLAYRNYTILDEAIDENSMAKIAVDNMETEFAQARNAARDALMNLGRLRQATWAGPMYRFLAFYRRLENLVAESGSLAGLAQAEILSDSQITIIDQHCFRAQESTRGEASAGDVSQALEDGTACTLPDYCFRPLPNNLGFESVIDLSLTLCIPGLAQQRLEDAKENADWAEKLDDEFLASETVKKTWQVQEAADEHNIVLETMTTKLHGILTNLEITMAKNGTDYQQYSPENRRLVLLAISLAKALRPLLENPVITSTGELSPGQAKAPAAGRALLAEVGNGVA